MPTVQEVPPIPPPIPPAPPIPEAQPSNIVDMSQYKKQKEEAEKAAAQHVIETASVKHGPNTQAVQEKLHQNLTGYLNQVAHTQPIAPDQLKPVLDQTPIPANPQNPKDQQAAQLMQKPKTEQDWEDLKAGWMPGVSAVRTDPSKNFLDKLKERAAKKQQLATQELPKAA